MPPKGKMGQKYLVSDKHPSMRLWELLSPDIPLQPFQREYETIAFALEGQADLHLENQIVV